MKDLRCTKSFWNKETDSWEYQGTCKDEWYRVSLEKDHTVALEAEKQRIDAEVVERKEVEKKRQEKLKQKKHDDDMVHVIVTQLSPAIDIICSDPSNPEIPSRISEMYKDFLDKATAESYGLYKRALIELYREYRGDARANIIPDPSPIIKAHNDQKLRRA